MQFVIVSGLSGAGKSKAASDLEDFGFYCVDNMPAEMIPQFASLCLATKGRYEKVALVTDVRGSLTFDTLFRSLDRLDEMHLNYSILFIEAGTETIIKRYKETRRSHPLTKDGTPISDAIARERELLQPIRNRASAIIDTSNLSTGKLRGMLIDNIKRVFVLSENVFAMHLRQHLHLREGLFRNRAQRFGRSFRLLNPGIQRFRLRQLIGKAVRG